MCQHVASFIRSVRIKDKRSNSPNKGKKKKKKWERRRVQKRQHFESVFLKIKDKLSRRISERRMNEEYFKTIVPHERRKFIALSLSATICSTFSLHLSAKLSSYSRWEKVFWFTFKVPFILAGRLEYRLGTSLFTHFCNGCALRACAEALFNLH